ncbi:MAG: hypothetical protein HP492_07485 [Nitrospira sp.]|nr:hypothetical protein [Nitrospira sp.]
MMLEQRLIRLVLFAGVAGLLLGMGLHPALLGAEEPVTISQSADYFPDSIGSRWTYKGQITEGPLQTVENKFFTNVSKVTGTKTIKGVSVTVFHDTTPVNHGPSESYYRRDVVGIIALSDLVAVFRALA